MPPEARDVREAQRDGLRRLACRVTGEDETTALVFSEGGHLQRSANFDLEGDAAMVWAIVEAIAVK